MGLQNPDSPVQIRVSPPTGKTRYWRVFLFLNGIFASAAGGQKNNNYKNENIFRMNFRGKSEEKDGFFTKTIHADQGDWCYNNSKLIKMWDVELPSRRAACPARGL